MIAPLIEPPQPSTHEEVDAWRRRLLSWRESLLIQLRVIEDMLGMPQSVPPKRTQGK